MTSFGVINFIDMYGSGRKPGSLRLDCRKGPLKAQLRV